MSTTSNPNINNISNVSSSQAPSTTQVLSTTPTPTPTKEVVFYTTPPSPPEESTDPTNSPIPSVENLLTSNIVTTSHYGSVILYFRPEYKSTYSTKFIATLSDSNYIKFNDYNSNVDVYKEGSNKVSFNILSKTDPAYIGLDFCSYKNNKITDNDSAYEIGKVTINSNDEWFKYKYSNNSDNEVDSTEIGIRFALDDYFDTSSYKTAPKINISYDYHTFNSYIKYTDTVTKNIEIQLLSPDQKNENPKHDYQSVNIKSELVVPFGLSKDLFGENGRCRFKINSSDNTEKYKLLQKYFKYNSKYVNNGKLPDNYFDFINTDIRELYLKEFPEDRDISITLTPYTYYKHNWPNNSTDINCTYSVTIKVPRVEKPTATTPVPTQNAPTPTR